MNGQIVREENIASTPPKWQHPILPAPAVQGSILITTTPFTTPPEDSSNFKWLAMEKVIGTADVKMEYDEQKNEFNFYKAKGHLDNDGEWHYDWEKFAVVVGISEETQRELQNLVYVSYIYDTDIANTLKVYGVKKDGTLQLLCDINFVSSQEFTVAINNLNNKINDEITRSTNKDTELENRISQLEVSQAENGTATTIEQTATGRKVNVNVGDGLTVNANNELVNNVIDDTLTTSPTRTYSIDKIVDITKHKWEYKGEVLDKTLLPASAIKGEVYSVASEKELYVNISDIATSNFIPMIEVAEAFNQYAIELHRGSNGLYARLRYDTIDFIIDNANNLKSQLIDDNIDASSPNANKKTYSVAKLLQLMSQAMHYVGQVETYADLPASANVGDVYNVLATGDNYAWSGSTWDNLGGEYLAGTGISIVGKTISATGIAFNVGDGLQIIGSGASAVLSTRIGDGLERVNVGTTESPINADKVKAGNGIIVNSNGVNVNVDGTTIVIDPQTNTIKGSQQLEDGNGIGIDTNNKINLLANFTIKETPLGNAKSKLALFSDNKIAVDFEEGQVVLTGELLKEAYFPLNSYYVDNVIIPKMNEFDMYVFDMGAKNNNTNIWSSYKQDIFFKPTVISDLFQTTPTRSSMSGDIPQGLNIVQFFYKQVNVNNNTIARIMGYRITSWVTGNWTTFSSTPGTSAGVKIYGIKAK